MTEFISRNHGHSCYEVIIKTTDEAHYKATVDFARQLIDHVKPVVPGPTEDNPNIMELCFHNGERNMKEEIIAKLMEHKTCVDGICHTQIAWLIKLLEDM